MIKLKSILTESNILISRRSRDERLKFYRALIYKKIRKYIRNGCKGDLILRRAPIDYLPKELKQVGGDLYITRTQISKLPDGLDIKGTLWAGNTLISEYPSNIQIGFSVDLENTTIRSLPDDLTMRGNMWLNNILLNKLPDNLTVRASLYVCGVNISEIPKNLNVGRDLHLEDTPLSKKYTREQIKQMIIAKGGSVGGIIYF